VFWLAGLWLVNSARKGLPWHDTTGTAPDGQKEPMGHAKAKKMPETSLARASAIFGAGALVTLAAGIVLEQTGEEIAGHIGMTGVVFGATILAAATSLPEVSTGIAAVKLGDYQLAVSDIFGGNAFLPVLFLLATLLSGQAVLPQAQKTDIYLTAVGVALTAVYVTGLLFRPTRRIARIGIDSLVVLVLYAIAVAGLFAIAGSG
jgi:cation:H+ antiporter